MNRFGVIGKTLWAAAAIVVAVVSVGCSTTSVEAIPPFRQGIVTAAQQSQTAFGDVNAMLRRQQIERAANQPTLNDASFAQALPGESLAAWQRAFASIDAYAGKLEALLAPERRTGVEEELRELGADLQSRYAGMGGADIDPGIAAGFVKLGGLLVELKAQRDALAAMRRVDPAVQEIFAAMAEAIGETNEDGVRGTVWTAWTQELGTLQAAFVGTPAGAARRPIAGRFLDMLAERETHDRLLASLRSSIVALAGAHARLAQGDRQAASGLIAIVQEEFKALREEQKSIKAAREAAEKGN